MSTQTSELPAAAGQLLCSARSSEMCRSNLNSMSNKTGKWSPRALPTHSSASVHTSQLQHNCVSTTRDGEVSFSKLNFLINIFITDAPAGPAGPLAKRAPIPRAPLSAMPICCLELCSHLQEQTASEGRGLLAKKARIFSLGTRKPKTRVYKHSSSAGLPKSDLQECGISKLKDDLS